MPVLDREDEATQARGRGRPRASETASASLVAILNLVRTGQATTRQEIERVGEFGRAVVADRLALLTELGLVDESELGAATGGRAPRLVRFAADKGRVLVATLDQTALGVGIADLSGRLLMEHHEPADLTEPAAAILDRVTSLFDWILSRQSGPGSAPWAVSLSVPAPVAEAGDTFLSETPPILPLWEGALFVEALVRRYGVPVWMRSSVETMTMGELHGGAGIGCTAMLFVKVGKRIGAGIVCDGRLWRGALGAAGLIGQLPVQAGERTGTLDALAGSEMIAREGQVAAEEGRSTLLADLQRRHGSLTAAEVSQAAQMGDRVSMEILSQSGRLIGHVVATLANALNPEIIVLSGSVAQSNDILLAAVREAVYGASHPLVTRDLQIVRSQMSRSAGLVGAAMVAVEGLFAPPMLKGWVLQGRPMAHPGFAALRGRLDGPPPAPSEPAAPRAGRI
ncbi:ROK family protein [Rubellimicrobium sp. CFH 75288]|uniref:ROK family protein n=1 Tax=Rubellimicrobium sp. CFH 75288 TaxID=2697034 RepID=UPI00141300C7|nr:ROK family protein [Rubellimicrobium sp. CFH 75288]NAZ38269.1 ROK family protein [Rubellimicrobium sp. CFH 75288]